MKVTVYTQVYNASAYLEKCVESVVRQTYQNFDYILIDNGSTDNSREIMQRYAELYPNIKLVLYDKNELSPRWLYHARENCEDNYLTKLDPDDWWEPTYLEELVNFAQVNNLDIACTGSVFHYLPGGEKRERSIPQTLVISSREFNTLYPYYHQFFRTTWGKLIRSNIVRQYTPIPNLVYGTDTVLVFSWLRQANRIGISNSVLHHYLIHNSSVSYQYKPLRFTSDIALFQDALDFLQGYGPVSLQNLTFLYIVYCNAVTDTLNVIEKSQLSPKEKLEEYKKIALEPITQGAYQVSDESATNSKGFLFLYMLKNASLVENSQDYLESLSFYLPHCSKVLAMADADLLGQNDAFFQPLLKDDASLLRDNLLQEFKKSPYRSQEKIVNLLSALTDELPVCKTATTHRFINHFFKIYGYLLHSQHLEALEEMTDLLLNHRVKDAQEVFFQVYLTLAALLQQEPAYLFGKIQMAEYLFSAKHYQEAAQIVAELEKMGLSEHDDVVKLKKKLARYLPA